MACIGFAPECMALEMLAPSVHNKGERVHISSHAHEGQETDSTLHQHLLFLLLHTQTRAELDLKHCSIRSSSLIYKCIHIFYSSVTPQGSNKQSLAFFSLMTAIVVSAILKVTGVQSSLPVEDRRFSKAPFMTSIPEEETQESVNSECRVC